MTQERVLTLALPAAADHFKLQELRNLSMWSKGQVWTSTERHGATMRVIKQQIDFTPLSMEGIRLPQGGTQVSSGSQSFKAIK